MHGRVFNYQDRVSIEANDTTAVEITADDKSVGDDKEWFSNACKQLFPTGKAGTALHYDTGFDERSCQRYAAGHVGSPAYFLRTLLRGDRGWTWLKVVMEGATAPWWKDLLYAYECALAFEARRKEMDQIKSISSSTANASRSAFPETRENG